MKSYPTDRVRNILIVGHEGQQARPRWSRLCPPPGPANRLGRVEDDTVTDFEPGNPQAHLGVLAVAPVEHDGYKINLLDAPGYADFIGDVRSALPTRRRGAVRGLGRRGRRDPDQGRLDHGRGARPARAFFISKLDRDRASFSCLDGIQASFGKACPPLYLPIGEERDFPRAGRPHRPGRAYTYDADSKQAEGDVPEGLTDAAASLREQLIEAVIQVEDEELMDHTSAGRRSPPPT